MVARLPKEGWERGGEKSMGQGNQSGYAGRNTYGLAEKPFLVAGGVNLDNIEDIAAQIPQAAGFDSASGAIRILEFHVSRRS